MRLGKVAKVRSGLVLSRKKATDASGVDYQLLTLRSIHTDGYIEMDQLDPYRAAQPLSEEYLTKAGDIVVRLTAPYTSVLINQNTEGVVISSNFVVIQTDREQLLPEYLYWLLNTRSVKRKIFECATSNMLSAVKSSFFVDFLIEPVSLEDQEKIAALNCLAKREAFLLRKLAEEKETYYAAMIENFYRNGKRSN